MSQEKLQMTLSPKHPLSGQMVQRISRSQGPDEEQRLRVALVNVGSMVGRSREVVEMLERRVDIGCVQEVRYKGQGACVFDLDQRCKFW